MKNTKIKITLLSGLLLLASCQKQNISIQKTNPMKMDKMNITFDEQEDDWWTCTSFEAIKERPAIRLILTSTEKPSKLYVENATKKLQNLEALILSASEEVLNNYSYDHYKSLGVSEENLEKEETAEAISKRATLCSIRFFSEDCKDFELSFEVPWDEDHSYDVEFENNEPVSCAVNG